MKPALDPHSYSENLAKGQINLVENAKPVLITGATGSIGSTLVRRLSEGGQNLRVVVRRPERAPSLWDMPNVEICQGDLSHPDSLSGCAEGCSQVFHCAAKLSATDWESSYAINVRGTEAFLDEAIRSGVERFIYTSSIAVYGLTRGEDISEEFPWPKCKLPYYATKQEAERRVWAAVERIPVAIARVGDVVGPGQHGFTLAYIEKINQGSLRPPPEKDSGYLNPVYIDNLIDALLLMSTHPAAVGQAFNVVDGTPILVSEYIRRMAQMAGKPAPALPVFVLKGVAALMMMSDWSRGREASVTPGVIDMFLHKATVSSSKIRDRLGWRPGIDLEEGFQRTEQWLRQEGYLAPAESIP